MKMAELPGEESDFRSARFFYLSAGRPKERRMCMATAIVKEEDVRKYCDSIYRELSEIKKKAFSLVCNVDTTTAAEEARRQEYFELFDLVDYIEKKLESLTKTCPSDWSGTKEEIESSKKRIDDALEWWYG